MTENELQEAIIDTAHVFGWRVAHFRPAKTEKGWRTPVGADGKGFPDLVLVRPPNLIFAELKSARGQVEAEQAVWLNDLSAVAVTIANGGLEEPSLVQVHVWRPDDWLSGSIESALR